MTVLSKTLVATVAACAMISPALAQSTASRAELETYVTGQIAGWVRDPGLIQAIKDQNAAHSHYTQDHLEALDMIWRGEAVLGEGDIIESVLSNSLSSGLRGRVLFSGGKVVEVFVMDDKGLNVASTGLTSDYWQGDEAKFQETFGNGAGAFHISEVEFDDSAGRYIAQLSLTIVDPATNRPIGAITVGVDAGLF